MTRHGCGADRAVSLIFFRCCLWSAICLLLCADNVWMALNKETGSTLMDSSAQLTVFLAETLLPDENGATTLSLRVFNPRSVRPPLDPEGHYASRPKLTYWPAVRQFDTPAAIAEYLGPALENTTLNFRLMTDGMGATFVQHGQVMREKRLVVRATNKQRGCAAAQRSSHSFHSSALSFFFLFFSLCSRLLHRLLFSVNLLLDDTFRPNGAKRRSCARRQPTPCSASRPSRGSRLPSSQRPTSPRSAQRVWGTRRWIWRRLGSCFASWTWASPASPSW